MRVFITGVGGASGVALAKSLSGRHYLIGADANPYAVGKVLVNEFHTIPLARSKDFIPQLTEVSRGCDVLFCTVDEELPIVAENSDKFGCKVLLSPPDSIRNCLDKLACMNILKRAGIPTPTTIRMSNKYAAIKNTLGLPFFVKPRRGRGSREIHVIRDRGDFIIASAVSKYNGVELIAQEFLEGDEFTVDVLMNEEGRSLVAVPRRRILTDSGVSTVGETVKDGKLEGMAKKAAEVLGLRYIVNLQMRRDEKGAPRVFEVNPRPSGTLSLTIAAGVHMPEIVLKMVRKEKVSDEELKFKGGISMFRYYHEEFFGNTGPLAKNPDSQIHKA